MSRPSDDPLWFGTPSRSYCCFAVSPDVSYCAVKTIICLKQSVHLRFLKHVARSNSGISNSIWPFCDIYKRQCKRNDRSSGGNKVGLLMRKLPRTQLISSWVLSGTQCSPSICILLKTKFQYFHRRPTTLIAFQQTFFLFPKLTINLKCINFDWPEETQEKKNCSK